MIAELKGARGAAIQSDRAAVPVHVEDAGIGLGLKSQLCFILLTIICVQRPHSEQSRSNQK